jgi:hypothetical protein
MILGEEIMINSGYVSLLSFGNSNRNTTFSTSKGAETAGSVASSQIFGDRTAYAGAETAGSVARSSSSTSTAGCTFSALA